MTTTRINSTTGSQPLPELLPENNKRITLYAAAMAAVGAIMLTALMLRPDLEVMSARLTGFMYLGDESDAAADAPAEVEPVAATGAETTPATERDGGRRHDGSGRLMVAAKRRVVRACHMPAPRPTDSSFRNSP